MPEALIAGHPVTWREYGPKDGHDEGRPALALHCSLGHSGAWGGLVALLGELRLTAPDLPGHGATPPPGDQDFHLLCTRIAGALAQQIGRGAPVDLIGHSLGATIALRLVLEQPGLVRSLTLVEPPFFAAARGSEAFAESEALQRGLVSMVRDDPEAAAARFHAVWGGGIPFAALPERARRQMASQMYLVTEPLAVLLDDAAQMLAPGRLEAVDLPVLLVEGSESPSVAHVILDRLAARIPGARRLRVQGAAHMVPITHPEPVAAELRALLARA